MILNNWNDVFKMAETLGIKIVPNVPGIGIEFRSSDTGKLLAVVDSIEDAGVFFGKYGQD